MQLMMLKCHLDNYHQGVESRWHELQQKFWILGLKNGLRSIKSRCVLCKNYSADVQVPLMADLFHERVKKVDFPFTYVGVDYFGPLEVKYMRRSWEHPKSTPYLRFKNSKGLQSFKYSLLQYPHEM